MKVCYCKRRIWRILSSFFQYSKNKWVTNAVSHVSTSLMVQLHGRTLLLVVIRLKVSLLSSAYWINCMNQHLIQGGSQLHLC